MSLLTILSFCLGLMVISLSIVSFINRQQTRRREQKSLIQTLQRRLGEQEDVCTAVAPLLSSTAILRLLNGETIRLAERLLALAPESQPFALRLERAEQIDLQLEQGKRPAELNRLLESDMAMARSKYSLTVAIRQLRGMQSQGLIDLPALDAYLDELAWAQLMVNVVSFVGHGHKMMGKGDTSVAMTFYRKALNQLMATQLNDERHQRCIQELSDIIAQKRFALSLDLMPESRYNPKSAPLGNQDSGSREADKSGRGSCSA